MTTYRFELLLLLENLLKMGFVHEQNNPVCTSAALP